MKGAHLRSDGKRETLEEVRVRRLKRSAGIVVGRSCGKRWKRIPGSYNGSDRSDPVVIPHSSPLQALLTVKFHHLNQHAILLLL